MILEVFDRSLMSNREYLKHILLSFNSATTNIAMRTEPAEKEEEEKQNTRSF